MGFSARFVKITLALGAGLLPFLVLPAVSLAHNVNTKNTRGHPGPGRIAASPVQTITIPFEFEAIDYSGGEHLPVPDLGLGTVEFINQAGSVALTVLALLDSYAVLGIFVIILAAVGVLVWFFSVVSGRSSTATLNVSGAARAGADLYERDLDRQEAGMNEMANDYPDPAYWSGQRAQLNSRRASVAKFRKVSGAIKRGSRRLRL